MRHASPRGRLVSGFVLLYHSLFEPGDPGPPEPKLLGLLLRAPMSALLTPAGGCPEDGVLPSFPHIPQFNLDDTQIGSFLGVTLLSIFRVNNLILYIVFIFMYIKI